MDTHAELINVVFGGYYFRKGDAMIPIRYIAEYL